MNTPPIHRRDLLTAAAATGLAAALPRIALADDSWKSSVTKYLESHARADGGYGWDGQERSHLTPTFAVVGCYKLLGIEPPNKTSLAQYVRTHHPRALKGRIEQELREFEWQQIQSLVWLGADASSFRETVESWKAPVAYLKQYEQHGYPVFQQEISAILSRPLLGLPLSELPPAYVAYLDARRRNNGSFNNTPAADSTDGHVLNTWRGLQSLDCLGRADELKNETIAWLQKCQLPTGGFTYQPNAQIGALDDVAYTWAAVRSLALLGAAPLDRGMCVEFLHSLNRDDGGFSDRRQWLSNPLATYYALDALTALGALDERPLRSAQKRSPRRALPDGLKVFSIQLEAHGQGSPAEAVELADALRIHLWGAKNAKPEWLERAKQIAVKQNVDVKFFVANEEYGTWIDVPGMGAYSHMSDVIAQSTAELGETLAGRGTVSWPHFQRRRLDVRLAEADFSRPRRGTLRGQLIWQFGENEPLVRMLLDDSLPQSNQPVAGFAAISTYHFGNPDFTNTEPFLMRYRGVLPFVALQDAHGTEPWWFSDMTEGFRTLFLATAPTWDGWLEALKNNWVVAVRHDAVSSHKTWMHGLPETIEFVRERSRDWQWWDNPAIQRPLVSIVALTPNDQFEIGRPEKGVAIRVRCAWENTTQGLPKTPLAALATLVVDGKPVEPNHVTHRRPNGAIEDDYYLHAWPDAPAGQHAVTATIKRLDSPINGSKSITFTIQGK